MKEFLKKYLSEDQLKELEEKYVADHPNVTSLPIYVGKNRLDEVIAQKKALEESYKNSEQALESMKGSIEQQIAEAVKKAQEEAAAHEKTALEDLTRSFASTEAIYKAHGKNVTAIKALIDPSKKVESEIDRLRKSDPYLFEDDIPTGTGRSGYDNEAEASAKELEQMRMAVGIF